MVAAPAAAFFVLRLALMSPPGLPDPSMHTTYLIDPHDALNRYAAVLQSTGRLREAMRPSFLVPGRIAYLLFGALPGFVVLRYVLALVAVAPAYVLLRRLYGRAAAVAGVIIVMSCPVLVVAWGTDYPDAAAVSYLTGGLASLAMPSSRRMPWLIAAAGLFTAAIWALASAALLVLATVAVYAVIRLRREREHLLRDVAVCAASAAVITGALGVGSKLFIGPFDYVIPTIQALIYLSHPSQVAAFHSANWHWAPYVSYLLVPPVTALAWLIAFGRRLRAVPTPQLLIGVSCAAQLAICVLAQFAGTVEVLEVDHFSSLLWASVVLSLALVAAHLNRRHATHAVLRWLPAAVALAVPLAYVIDPHVPAFGWVATGATVAAAALVAAITGKISLRIRSTPLGAAALASSLVVLLGAILVLTVAPIPGHPQLEGIACCDPPPAYAASLGGNAAPNIDQYRATVQLPAFVGNATYRGEQLLTWWPEPQSVALLGPIGIYHSRFNEVPGGFGELRPAGRAWIVQRKPAEILLLGTTEHDFARSLRSLQDFDPVLVKTGVLRSGSVAFHVWLIDLRVYLR